MWLKKKWDPYCSSIREKDFEIKVAMKLHTVWGHESENLVGFNFWPLFVTKNGILRFSAFGLIKWPWIKSSKWNYPQFRGCGSKNYIGLNFSPLFVTRNGILLFSAFGWTKWPWLKIANETIHNIGVTVQKILLDWIFYPFFRNQTLYILFFSFWLYKTVMRQKEQLKPPTIWLPRIEKFV